MPDVVLSGSLSVPLVLLSFGIAAVVSYLVYRRTLPPLSRPSRIGLGIFRFLVLFLLLYLLGEPLLSFVTTIRIPPAVGVLMDNSRSMSLTSAGDAAAAYERIAGSSEFSRLENAAQIRWFAFDNALRPVDEWSPEAVPFDGDRTNIAGAFEALLSRQRGENIQAYILLTDGNPTTPVNPTYAAEALGVPVFTIGIGDTSARKDVLISGVQHNSIAYAGTRIPVQVTVRASGYEADPVQVVLSVGGTPVDRSTLVLNDGAGDQRTTLFMTPESAGTLRARVSITRLDGEVTYENNTASFSTTVLSGKRTVLVIAGAPGEDVSFIRRSLAADSNLAVVTRIERPDGSFLEGPITDQLVRRSDAVFLVGFPGPSTNAQTLRMIASEPLSQKPLFFLLERRTDASKLRTIAPLLPVTISGLFPSEFQIFLSVPEATRRHPLFRQSQESVWNSLPPIFRPQGQFTVKPEAQVVATVRLQTQVLSDPLVVVRSAGGRRSVAVLAYGLWRWKMLSPQGGRPDSPFDEFLRNAVQWLTAIADQRRFRVEPAQETFSAFEQPSFRAELYDESMEPVNDAAITVSVTGEGQTSSITLSPTDNGQYEGRADALPPGEYTYRATASAGANELGTAGGSFGVGDLQAEFLETRLNRDLLKSIASRTGGSSFDGSDVTGLADSVMALPGFRAREFRSGTQIDLAHSGWILGGLLVLLTLEWFFRKRLGLL